LSTAQAQQAALLQMLIGNFAFPKPNPVQYHTSNPSTNQHPFGFTPKQQAHIDTTTQLAVSKALAARSQASMSTQDNLCPTPLPPAGPSPRQALPPRQLHYDGTSNGGSVRMNTSSFFPTGSVGTDAGASFTLLLPDALDPFRDKPHWWEPTVRTLYESIGFGDIMDRKKLPCLDSVNLSVQSVYDSCLE
jgi:hypothetical protein